MTQLDCRGLVELVTEYLEGGLVPQDRARFEAHVADCEGCSNHLEQMRTTIRVLGSLPEDAIERHARDDLLRAFRDWKRA